MGMVTGTSKRRLAVDQLDQRPEAAVQPVLINRPMTRLLGLRNDYYTHHQSVMLYRDTQEFWFTSSHYHVLKSVNSSALHLCTIA